MPETFAENIHRTDSDVKVRARTLFIEFVAPDYVRTRLLAEGFGKATADAALADEVWLDSRICGLEAHAAHDRRRVQMFVQWIGIVSATVLTFAAFASGGRGLIAGAAVMLPAWLIATGEYFVFRGWAKRCSDKALQARHAWRDGRDPGDLSTSKHPSRW